MVSATKVPTAGRNSRISIVSPPSKDVPQCTPNLMPFHIAHDGPAPVSTYFRVEDAKTHVASPEPQHHNSNADVAPEERAGNGDIDAGGPSASSPQVPAVEPEAGSSGISTLSPHTVANEQPRFISAFRGRTVQGLKVDLPEGYTGVVFQSGDEGKKKSKGKPAVKGKGKLKVQDEMRTTRRSTRSRIADDMDVDESEDDGEEDENLEGAMSTLNLEPSAQFKSFVLWHPDLPVDTGKDEYISSIEEWMKIAAVLHQTPTELIS
ncbi:hypothetical protein GYMLUDRAFT_68607 [Collybiopsis luxurians FD-317 M1]|nr:hypothetical protein GYMLUDRAFT_68607 [Collybiopsis luxurians FD-317 M1]